MKKLSEHCIGKNHLFGCCTHEMDLSTVCMHSRTLLNLWKPYPLRNQFSFKECLDNAWHAGQLIDLTGLWLKYMYFYTACACHEAEPFFTTIIPQWMLLCWCTEGRSFLFLRWPLGLVGRSEVLSYVDPTRPHMAILVIVSCVAQGEELREKQCVCCMLNLDTDGEKTISEILLCTLTFLFP